jgi:hypothetical protein
MRYKFYETDNNGCYCHSNIVYNDKSYNFQKEHSFNIEEITDYFNPDSCIEYYYTIFEKDYGKIIDRVKQTYQPLQVDEMDDTPLPHSISAKEAYNSITDETFKELFSYILAILKKDPKTNLVKALCGNEIKYEENHYSKTG